MGSAKILPNFNATFAGRAAFGLAAISPHLRWQAVFRQPEMARYWFFVTDRHRRVFARSASSAAPVLV